MSTRIEDMASPAREHAEAATADLKAAGVTHVVTSTNRTALDQITFYLQGRGVPLEVVNLLRKYQGLRLLGASENINPVTWCDGVNTLSNHQGGRALDVVPADIDGNPCWPAASDLRWVQISSIMKRHGFAWGGDWPAPKTDLPHYEYTGGSV